jgi:ADP-ribosylglycohydrolase
MNNNLYNKILGSLAGCAIGDAMGAATELLNSDEILRRFGGIVQDFKCPPAANPYAGGREAGQITDDASLTFYLAEAYITAGGKISPRLVADTILRWSDNYEYFPRFAGPSTKSAISRLRQGEDPVTVGLQGEISPGGVTNGGAMKVSPAGLVNPGNFEQAISDAIIICQPTHGTQIAMSGAAAIACAIAEALVEGSTTMSVIKSAVRGAVKGEMLGKRIGRIAAGPSVVKRMNLAIHIALTAPDAETACRKIGEYVGSGLHMAEAVPAALGLFLATEGELFETIKWAVNIGDDTDTVAAIAGSVAGAFRGFKQVPPQLYQQVTEINHLELDKLAAGLTKIAECRLS